MCLPTKQSRDTIFVRTTCILAKFPTGVYYNSDKPLIPDSPAQKLRTAQEDNRPIIGPRQNESRHPSGFIILPS